MTHQPLPRGRRVVVRSVLPGELGPSGGPAMTDVVGILEACDDDHVEVRRRDGSLRRVARADIVALKVVSTPPPRPRGPADDAGDSG